MNTEDSKVGKRLDIFAFIPDVLRVAVDDDTDGIHQGLAVCVP